MFAYSRPTLDKAKMDELVAQFMSFGLRMQFILKDKKRRTFVAQRPSFWGWFDDWIDIDKPGKLPTLVKKHVKLLGEESFDEFD
jgi:hypothetical protein